MAKELMKMNNIKVLIIDPSINFRSKLKTELQKYKNVKINSTGELKQGRDFLVYDTPDVLVISKNITEMNILKFLKKVFKYKMIATIVTGDFESDKDLALDLIDLGVLDVVSHTLEELLTEELLKKMLKKIFATSIINVNKEKLYKHAIINKNLENKYKSFNKNQIIAIGASTGGPLALREIIKNLPKDMPPILIAQHMPGSFITSFSLHLDKISQIKVVEAKDNELIKAGTVYIAPGDRHLEIKRKGPNYYTALTLDEPVHFQRPAVEVLFNSFAKHVGKNAIGVILTGMGRDGAKGLLNMKKHGAYTIGQDEESSIVYGMPKEAFDIGAVKKQVPLDKIPMYLFKLTRSKY